MDRREDEGFTLIELMVVVLIIAILMAIAIPTFLSARNTANARAAQSNLRNGITTEQTQYAANGYYDNSITGNDSLKTLEPGLVWAPTSAGALTANTVYVEANAVTGSAATEVLLTSLGSDKNCYYQLDESGQVGYSSAPATGAAKNVCTAPAAATKWYDNWADAHIAAATGASIVTMTGAWPATWTPAA